MEGEVPRRAVERGVAEGEDPAVGRHQPVALSVVRRRHAHDGFAEGEVPRRAVELCVAEGEHLAVPGRHPVPRTARRGRHRHHRRLQVHLGEVAQVVEVGVVAEATQAAVAVEQVVPLSGRGRGDVDGRGADELRRPGGPEVAHEVELDGEHRGHPTGVLGVVDLHGAGRIRVQPRGATGDVGRGDRVVDPERRTGVRRVDAARRQRGVARGHDPDPVRRARELPCPIALDGGRQCVPVHRGVAERRQVGDRGCVDLHRVAVRIGGVGRADEARQRRDAVRADRSEPACPHAARRGGTGPPEHVVPTRRAGWGDSATSPTHISPDAATR